MSNIRILTKSLRLAPSLTKKRTRFSLTQDHRASSFASKPLQHSSSLALGQNFVRNVQFGTCRFPLASQLQQYISRPMLRPFLQSPDLCLFFLWSEHRLLELYSKGIIFMCIGNLESCQIPNLGAQLFDGEAGHDKLKIRSLILRCYKTLMLHNVKRKGSDLFLKL